VDEDDCDRFRRELLLHYARIEAFLLAQPRTPEVSRHLADLRRSRDDVARFAADVAAPRD
jgi:hypothetical protein